MPDDSAPIDTGTHPARRASAGRRAAQGAGIAAVLVALFLVIGGDWNDTGRPWWILPLILVPMAGALGGLLFHATDSLRRKRGWKGAAAIVAAILGYALLLAAGFVLGMNGPN